MCDDYAVEAIESVDSVNASNTNYNTQETYATNDIQRAESVQESYNVQQGAAAINIDTNDTTQISDETKSNPNESADSSKNAITSNSLISKLNEFLGNTIEFADENLSGFLAKGEAPLKDVKTISGDIKYGSGAILNEKTKAGKAFNEIANGTSDDIVGIMKDAKGRSSFLAGTIGAFYDGQNILSGTQELLDGDSENDKDAQEKLSKGSAHMISDLKSTLNGSETIVNDVQNTAENVKNLINSGEKAVSEIAEDAVKTGSKEAVEDVTEEAVKAGSKETADVAEEVVKTGSKEAVENVIDAIAETGSKEATEKVIETLAKTGSKEAVESVAESGLKGTLKAVNSTLGKATPVVSGIVGGVDGYFHGEDKAEKYIESNNITDKEKADSIKTNAEIGGVIGGAAGSIAGDAAGAAIGAAIGSCICPGVGTVIGGFIGAMVVGQIGSDVGAYVGSEAGIANANYVDTMVSNGDYLITY